MEFLHTRAIVGGLVLVAAAIFEASHEGARRLVLDDQVEAAQIAVQELLVEQIG